MNIKVADRFNRNISAQELVDLNLGLDKGLNIQVGDRYRYKFEAGGLFVICIQAGDLPVSRLVAV